MNPLGLSMSRTTRLAATASVLLVCTVALRAHAGDLFDGLGPDLAGAELSAVLEGAELACAREPSAPDLRRCRPLPGALDALGSVPLTEVEAQFVGGQLAQVTAYFPERRFAEVKRLLSERLGPSQDWTVVIRSGMAGQFSDEIRIWETERFVLIAQQFDRKIDRSSAIYGTPTAMAQLLRQIRSTPRGGMRDL